MDRRRLLLAAAASAVAAACGSTGASASPSPPATATKATVDSKATIELAKGGSFSFTLRPDKAPGGRDSLAGYLPAGGLMACKAML